MSILKESKYTIEPTVDPTVSYPIDFIVRDTEDDIVATVYGDKTDGVEIDCDHTYMEYDGADTCGVCLICGAECLWHEEESEDGKEKIIDSWSIPLIHDCIIQEEIDGE